MGNDAPRVRLFTPAALILVVTVYAVLSEHTFIGICFIYHEYSEVWKIVGVDNIFTANLVVMRCNTWRIPPPIRFIESYLTFH